MWKLRAGVVDDACAFAWVQFMRPQPDRERNWRSWLITTAEREAWRLRREESKTLSFEFETVDDLQRDPVDPRDQVDERARLRHALEFAHDARPPAKAGHCRR